MNEESKKGGDIMTTTSGFCNQCIFETKTNITIVRDFIDINGNSPLIGRSKWQLPNYPMLSLCDKHMVNYTVLLEYKAQYVA